MSDIIMINEQDYTEILQRAVALLPWSHNVLILSKDLLELGKGFTFIGNMVPLSTSTE